MSHWSATCLSSETADTNLSILVESDSSRYIFNCGEGTTRALLQRKKGLRKFKAIFMSGVGTERWGGLPGLMMTLADSGTSKLKVFGSPGIEHFLASTRLYTMRETLSVETREIFSPSSSPVFADETLSVFAVPVLPDDTSSYTATESGNADGSLKRKHAPESDQQPPFRRKKEKTLVGPDSDASPSVPTSTNKLDASIWSSHDLQPVKLTGLDSATWRQLVIQHMFPGATNTDRAKDAFTMKQFNKRLPYMARNSISLCYVLLGAQGRGKFDAAKAQALGLKSGPARGKLAKGETVVTPEGTVITPDMVLGPPPRPDVLIFIDCPSPRHIAGLVCSGDFERYKKGGEYPVHCMIHLAGPNVLEDRRYGEWLADFGDGVHHLYTGPGRTSDRITFTSTAYAQLRLSHLDSGIFHVPKTLTTPPTGVHQVLRSLKIEDLKQNHFVGMKPPKAPILHSEEEDGIDLYHPAVRKGGVRDFTSLLQPKTIYVFERARHRIAEDGSRRKSSSAQPGDDVVITPLGTSSAMPSKYRNVSSLLVDIPETGYILLDCGEGTLGQLRRHFGDDAQRVLRNIRCIFISHIHGDHHIGLSRLLSERRKLEPRCTSPVYLIANQATLLYLNEYSDLEDLGLNDPSAGVCTIYSEHAHFARRPYHTTGYSQAERQRVESSQRAIRELNAALNLTSSETVDVWHRGRCHGLVVKHRDGWSIVYSGDTRPSDTLVRVGKEATLLIHEATFGDDQEEEAALKAHSTVGQAIDVAKRMQANNVLLTHFSNRFPKTPQVSNETSSTLDGPTVAVAFDHASISIGDMWKMERYLPAIEQSFLDSEDPEDEVVESLGKAP